MKSSPKEIKRKTYKYKHYLATDGVYKLIAGIIIEAIKNYSSCEKIVLKHNLTNGKQTNRVYYFDDYELEDFLKKSYIQALGLNEDMLRAEFKLARKIGWEQYQQERLYNIPLWITQYLCKSYITGERNKRKVQFY